MDYRNDALARYSACFTKLGCCFAVMQASDQFLLFGSFEGHCGLIDRNQSIQFSQLREHSCPDCNDDQCSNSTQHNCGHGAKPLCSDAGLKLSEFVRCSDEHTIHGTHTPAHGRGCCDLHECAANYNADHIGGADHE